jgi:hypothetical protein
METALWRKDSVIGVVSVSELYKTVSIFCSGQLQIIHRPWWWVKMRIDLLSRLQVTRPAPLNLSAFGCLAVT